MGSPRSGRHCACATRSNPVGVLRRIGGIARAGVGVEGQFHVLAGFGVFQFEFAFPGRLAIFVRPDVQQDQLMAEVGQILERLFAILIIQEIRDHQQQAPAADSRAMNSRAAARKSVWPPGFKSGEKIHGGLEAMAAAATR